MSERATVLQALGHGCFSLDPDQRPTFRQCVEQLSSMLTTCSDATRAGSLEARQQTRPNIESAQVPEALTCASQAPIHTEAGLGLMPNGTVVAA